MPSVSSESSRRTTRILGINFFHGTAGEAVVTMRKNGGLLVVPAAPALKDLATNQAYRDALLNADLAITDSGFMVIVWNLLTFSWISRLSGLQYLRCLLRQNDIRQSGNVFWIMASKVSADCNLEWLAKQGIRVPEDYVYIAPLYTRELTDMALLEKLNSLQPKHIILTLGGGTQERLGLYLKRGLSYRPAIHCIGAAIAFLSGDQVRIPAWADTLFLGWLFRSLSDPGRYVPRYWDARKLFGLMARYRSRLPEPIVSNHAQRP